jgi:hypothetical protein
MHSRPQREPSCNAIFATFIAFTGSGLETSVVLELDGQENTNNSSIVA